MTNPSFKKNTAKPQSSPAGRSLDPEKYARLREELRHPYRGLRMFVYFACGASGLIGAFIFLTQLAAGRAVDSTLPNFILQIGVVAIMVGLYRWERRLSRKGR